MLELQFPDVASKRFDLLLLRTLIVRCWLLLALSPAEKQNHVTGYHHYLILTLNASYSAEVVRVRASCPASSEYDYSEPLTRAGALSAAVEPKLKGTS
jgi:hypothetical protein